MDRRVVAEGRSPWGREATEAAACILVVDDDPEIIAVVKALLEADYRIEALDDFSDVAGAARAIGPDLILLDWNLPGVSGLDLCTGLAADPELAGAPVLLMTGRTSINDETRGLRAGAADYIRKPISPDVLRARIRNHLIARAHLLGVRRELADTTTAHRRTSESKTAITSLLETALEPLTLQAQLEAILGIINTIPWLESAFQGAIFLADGDGVLTLAASRSMPPEVRSRCARVVPGKCLCGRAAQERRLIFADRVEGRVVPHDDLGEHGQYCLPLAEGERLIGVLSILVRAGHRPAAGEFAFMEEVAKAVSGLISRRLMESILEIRKFELQESQAEVIRMLGRASEYRDTETGLHLVRVAHFARRIAEAAGLPAADVELVFLAAPMHDVGKIGIPDEILLNPGQLSDEDFEVMKTHTTIGEEILAGDNAVTAAARVIAASHHERWDGGGYPRGLAGEEIPLLGRVVALADVFDALGQSRPYKKAWPLDRILAHIRENAGRHFDPALVDAFFKVAQDIVRLHSLYSDELIDPRRQAFLVPMETGGGAEAGSEFAWRDGYSVGIGAIDDHHRYLLDLMNGLNRALSAGGGVADIARALKALESYAVVHFTEEERMMAAFGYAGYETHARQHAAFVARINQMWQTLRSNPLLSGHETLGFLRDWLITHIQVSDTRMASAIRTATSGDLKPGKA